MKKPDTSKYNKSYIKFKEAVNNFIKKLIDKLNKLTTKTITFTNNEQTITLQDNTIYKYTGDTGVTKLTIKYPEGDFISTILFSTATTGTITVIFPSDSLFVGHKKLEFFKQEHWEISIHNKRVCAVQVFEKN